MSQFAWPEQVGTLSSMLNTLEGQVRVHSWGRIATLADPFGHGLCLMQMAPGAYASVAG